MKKKYTKEQLVLIGQTLRDCKVFNEKTLDGKMEINNLLAGLNYNLIKLEGKN